MRSSRHRSVNDQHVIEYKCQSLRLSLVCGESESIYKGRDHVYLNVDLVRRLDDDELITPIGFVVALIFTDHAASFDLLLWSSFTTPVL